MKKLLYLWLIGLILALTTVFPYLNINTDACIFNGGIREFTDEDDYPYYGPRITAFAKGFWGIGDPVYWEHRADYLNSKDKFSIIVTGLIQIISGDINKTFIISRIIFLPLSFILLTLLLNKLVKNIYYSIVIAALIILSPELINFLGLSKDSVLVHFQYSQGRYFRRFPNNLINTPVFLTYLLLSMRVFGQKFRATFEALLLGLFTGLLSLVYFYYWFVAVIFFMIVGAYSYLKHRGDRLSLKNIIAGFFLAFISSLPFGFLAIQESLAQQFLGGYNPYYKLESLGAFRGHWYSGNTRSIARSILIIFALTIFNKLLFRAKKIRTNSYFAMIVLLYFSIELAFNSNVITGISLQPDHFMYTIGWMVLNVAIFTLIGMLIIQIVSSKFVKPLMLASTTLVVIFSVYQTSKIINPYNSEHIYCHPSTIQLHEELNKLDQHSVILPLKNQSELSSLILNHSNHFVFSYWTGYSTASFDEVLQRKAYVDKLLNFLDENYSIPVDSLSKSFQYSFMHNKFKPPIELFTDLQGMNLDNCEFWCDATPNLISKQYNTLLIDTEIDSPPFKLDYIVIDPNQLLNLKKSNSFSKVLYSNQEYALIDVIN